MLLFLWLSIPGDDIDGLLARAGYLGEQYLPSLAPKRNLIKKPVKCCNIDQETLVDKPSSITLDNNFVDINYFANNVTDVL